MDARELRIGNITKQGTIKTFYEYGIHIGAGKCYHFNDVKPIPLTKEWLEKLDFVYGRYTEGWKRKHADDYITPIRYHEGNYTMLLNRMWVKIKYVHQLQNLYYSLTGKELNVNNKF